MADFQGLVTLTLDRVILHTIMHHSSTSTSYQIHWNRRNFLWMDERTGRGHWRPTLLGRLGVDLKIWPF